MKRKVLSACIALALSGNSWADTDVTRRSEQVECPADIDSLSKEKKAQLPATCQQEPSFMEEEWGWVVGGLAAVAATVGITLNNDDGGHHNSNDGGNTPVPPDDGGDNTPTPPAPGYKAFTNGVVWDEASSTLKINGVVWSYSKNADGTYTLTDPVTGQTAVLVKWVDNGNGTITLTGKNSDGSKYWVYDNTGKFSQTDLASWYEGDGQQINTSGGETSGAGNAGQIISGDGNKADISGDTSAKDGGTGTMTNGDNNEIHNGGKNSADGSGSTGTKTDGDNNKINTDGDNSAINGGTGIDTTGNGNQIDTNGNNSADGQGSTGTKTDGNGNTINNGGENKATDGGTGTDTKGDDNTINNKGGNTAEGTGSTGTKTDGDNNKINTDGDNTATGGGTGIDTTGNGNQIDTNGNTTGEGAGSTGSKTEGDGNIVNTGGETKGTDGGTGAEIKGDGNEINNTGGSSASGTGSTGTKIDGNDNTINNTGGSSASTGGTGTDVTGDGNEINTGGNSTVEGAGSTGTAVNGGSNTINNTGDAVITDGGTGTKVSGDKNTVVNDGSMSVSGTDENTPSRGVMVEGNGNDITQKGAMNVGDFSVGLDVTGNDNIVSLESTEMNITGQKATGVNVAGEGNNVTLSGDMTVDKDQKADNAAQYFYDASTGIAVSGGNNTVSLNGKLTVVSDEENAGHQYAEARGTQETIKGLTVTGDGNTVNLNQGITLKGEVDAIADIPAGDIIANARKGSLNHSVVNVSGKSTVNLSGASTIEGDFPAGVGSVFMLSDGASLNVMDGAALTMNISTLNNYNYEMQVSPLAKLNGGATATIDAGASVQLQDIAGFQVTGTGTTVTNNGVLEIDRTSLSQSGQSTSLRGLDARDGGEAINTGLIVGRTLNQDAYSEINSMTDAYAPGRVYSMQLMAASGKDASVTNSQSGRIELYGRGYAMSAQAYYKALSDGGRADNYGNIMTDVLWTDPTDTTSSSLAINISSLYDVSAGMIVGSGSNGGTGSNAVATNHAGGTITVYNAGAGMIARGNNTVINQGTINLEKNANYDPNAPLVGMAVYSGGTAINDTTGVININADNGVAFYSDGNANNIILNYGTICTQGNCQDPDSYNPGDSKVNLAWDDGDIMAATGATTTVKTQGFVRGTVSNSGTVTGGTVSLMDNSTLVNNTGGRIDSMITAKSNVTVSNMSGATLSNLTVGVNNTVNNSGTIDNLTVSGSGSVINNSGVLNTGKDQAPVNNGVIFNNMDNGKVVAKNTADPIIVWAGTLNNWGEIDGNLKVSANGNPATVYNAGVVNGSVLNDGNNANNTVINSSTGVINIDSNNQIAMSADKNMKMVNDGTINVGSIGTGATGMVGMQLEKNATANAVIENNGTININASNSYAFSKLGTSGHVVNNGTVVFASGVTGSSIFRQSGITMEGKGDGGDGTEVHYVDYDAPTEPAMMSVSNRQPAPARNNLSGYVVGTSANGSAGKLMVNNASMKGVSVNTGFATGTDATTMSFDDVVQGSDLSDADAITSTSAVWTAQGEKDAQGNVDVTMSKNAYTDVVNDSSVSSVAAALDAGYTNNELYNSLNLATSSDVTKAMKQISGSMASSVSRDARVLSNRFDMLADTAPVMKNGLAFNVVAQGDKRAELGNNTQYDMMALRQKLQFGSNQTLSMEYGIARINGDSTDISAGDNGLAGGYSQFFGLEHEMPLGENGLSWNNALRYDVHQFDSNRSISYGDVNENAKADTRQQYLEFRTEGRKTFSISEGFDVAPYVGLKMRHTLEDGYRETGAGDFNLNMSSNTETAVDSVAGLKLNYTGKNGWAATATLEGGPNLSYANSGKTASLQGAAGQSFSVDDGQKGGGINSLAQVGVKYNAGNTSAGLEAFHWKEDGISDKGLMMNYKLKF